MRRIFGLAMLAVLLGPAWAQAHFLFLRIGPAAEGGRAAEVYFSEYASAGDPRYIDKVATAQFAIQTTPGQFQPLPMQKLTARLRGRVSVAGPLMVAGQLDYGVLDRPGEKPFLIRHFSKAVTGKAAEVVAFTPRGTRLEVLGTPTPDGMTLTALLDGKPMPGAKFTTVAPDLTGEELIGDSDGKVVFKPESRGVHCVYIGHVEPSSGEHAGKRYDEIREFATLSFAWPLEAQGADAEAVEMFETALANRAAWRNFPGFTAKISGTVDGRPFDGDVAVAADGAVKLKLDNGELEPWVEDQLSSITMHRAASQTPAADRPKPMVRFADEDLDHPLGRLLTFEGGHFASSYRVRDGQIVTVNRLIDGQNMTITALDNKQNADGKLLPHLYTVEYWDADSGNLARTETVQDTWTRVGQWDLPARHVVTTASPQGFSTRAFQIDKHQLAPAPAGK